MEIRYKELTVDNLFDCCAVLDAIGTEQILAAFDKNEIAALTAAGKDAKGIGVVITMKMSGIIIKNIPAAKSEICTFFANCIEWDNGTAVTTDEIRSMNITTFVKVIKGFFKQDGITDFFREVAGFVGMEQADSQNGFSTDTAIPNCI